MSEQFHINENLLTDSVVQYLDCLRFPVLREGVGPVSASCILPNSIQRLTYTVTTEVNQFFLIVHFENIPRDREIDLEAQASNEDDNSNASVIISRSLIEPDIEPETKSCSHFLNPRLIDRCSCRYLHPRRAK